ncbi:saccharopine dehydrogenase-like oxidoreductase-like isoform X2 [Thraustotheca clavata]|uniref:Saccharopine dehydrogenase-like oxidoreductase-like isoform X2 n=1 Tax=Thraustotheca clavata TaxID=74557 RepID=A0A1V9Y6S9_9STRA|nr:saccharopine dehydrogenase-like oxidoreductase-like isoform X2 [Thraustotheca clavata]
MTDTKSRKYDAVIFGATGFTGQYIATEWARTAKKDLRWAIAGRSLSKLEAVQSQVRATTAYEKDIPIIVADVFNESAMRSMCASTRLLINCTGPFRLFGEPVVQACVAEGTHYVDITGEPQFIETMILRYNEDAITSGSLIVHSCGFDSIPSDMGVVYTSKQFPNNGVCSSIETFISLQGNSGHATTYECIVLGLASAKSLKTLRSTSRVEIPYVGPKLKVHSVGFDKRMNKYYIKFLGSDASVVRLTQKHLVLAKSPVQPVQFSVYVTFESILRFIPIFFGALFLLTFGYFEWGRNLLIKYPAIFTFGWFSHEGPSQEEIENSGFSHQFFAKGYKDKNNTEGNPDWEVVAKVQGPEPGYLATSSMIVNCAYVILDGEVKERGVMTPGAAFRSTSLIDRLQNRGIHFTVSTNQSIEEQSTKQDDSN